MKRRTLESIEAKPNAKANKENCAPMKHQQNTSIEKMKDRNLKEKPSG
jgi:hypothetical protein